MDLKGKQSATMSQGPWHQKCVGNGGKIGFKRVGAEARLWKFLSHQQTRKSVSRGFHSHQSQVKMKNFFCQEYT